ncbi:MAG: tetratricopeptide repeat protein [Sedimentisphaerales bacterium]|nr:tetratricopeptide repeat protein [Sedimentisphaerales bacterium]
MEATAQVQSEIDLFGAQLPNVEQIKKLSQLVHSSEANLIAFKEQVEQNMSKTGAKGCLATGIGLYILGNYADAVEKMHKGGDCVEKFVFFAYALRNLGRFDEAVKLLDAAAKHGADSLAVTLDKSAVFRRSGDFESAQKQLSARANFKNVSAEYHYQLGRLQEAQGLYEEAMNNYKAAIELDAHHQEALFALALRCDLSGDEDAAIDYYKAVASASTVYVNALLNLAVIYEDREQFDKASQCVEKVLACHPNHKRAMLFRKDIDSSKTMVYDEETEKKKTRKMQILETPISDFELSVRSRNCLKKMNINTLGDLLRTSEAELLAFKNFGETSLREIKAILNIKGLQIGMGAGGDKPIISLVEPSREDEEVADELLEDDQGLLSKPLADLQWSVRVKNALQKLDINTLGDLTRLTEAELLGCKNFGVTSLNEVKRMLSNLGLSLRTLD